MSTVPDLRSAVAEYVADAVQRLGELGRPGPDDDLLARGLTSLACVKIMVAVEGEFQVLLPDEFLSLETFATVQRLTDAVFAAVLIDR